MKKVKVLLIVLLLTFSLFGCGKNTNSNTSSSKAIETKQSKPDSISDGVYKLGNKAIETFDKYHLVKINKTELIETLNEIEEHINDIQDPDCAMDYMVYMFVSELNKKVQSEYCDLSDMKLPYEDLKSVLNDEYVFDGFTESHEFEKLSFCLPPDWEEVGKGQFKYNAGTTILLSIESFAQRGLFENENVDAYIKQAESVGYKYDQEYDYYKSRNLNYFYILKGQYEDVKIHTVLYDYVDFSSVGYNRVYRIDFYHNDSFDESIVTKFLDTIPELD